MFDFSTFPEIETARLKLRCLAENDAASIYAVRSDFEVTKYNSGAAYTDISQAVGLISRSIDGFQNKRSLYWALLLKESGEVVGQLGYNCWDQENHSADVGFDLRRDYWGKGIMKEALGAIISFGLQNMGLNRIGAQVSTYNDNCVHLLESLGFKHEGTMREQYYENGEYHDLKLYAILKKECNDSLLKCNSTVKFVDPPITPVISCHLNW